MQDPATGTWFLPGTPWTAGNRVRPLVHGATYFRRLHDELQQLRAGDRVYFTDWRGDPDERLLPEGPTVGGLLTELCERGVEVRGLVWRSHTDLLQFSATENEHLGKELNEAGGEVLLDQRVRWFGSHHQKLVVLRHRGEPERDVAFVGGIDLCHGRRDDARHAGDPQQSPIDRRYGHRAPWHDATLELRGPVVGLLITVAILFVLRSAATDIYRRLMDAVDPELVQAAEASLLATPGVREVEEVRLRWIGHRIRAEVGLVVDAGLSLVQAHAVATDAHHRLLHDVRGVDDATVHVSPSSDGHEDHHSVLAHHRTGARRG